MKTPTMTAARKRFLLTMSLVIGAGGCFAGCAQTREEAIRADLTPELATLHQRQVDVDNATTLTFDENGRMFVEDLNRFLLINRPSRLTPEPIPRP